MSHVSSIFKDEWGLRFSWVIALIVGVALAMVVALVAVSAYFDSVRCSQVAEELGTNYHYRIVSGCYVQTIDDQFVPLGNYRSVEVAK